MNRQTISNTDSAGNLLEAGCATKSNFSTPRKYKLVLIIAGVIVTVAVCTVVAVAVGTSQSLNKVPSEQLSETYGINHEEEDLLDTEMEEQLFMDVSTCITSITLSSSYCTCNSLLDQA